MSAQEGIQQAEQRYLINWRRVKGNAPLIGLAAALVLLLGGLALHQLSVPLQILILAIFAASVVALRYDVVTCAVAIAVAILFDYYQLIAMPHGFPWVGLLMIGALLYALCVGVAVSMTIHWLSEFVAGAIIGSVIGIVVGRSFRDRLSVGAAGSTE